MTPAFRSLRHRNYRLFAAGQLVSVTGTWMQRVAQDWLVLELTNDSGVALGIATGLQFLPMLLFGLYGGVLADRYDKRTLIMGTQAAMGVLALALGALVVSGEVELWHVYTLALLLGLAAAVEVPARQSFVVEMVGPADLPNAVSLNSATFNSGRVLGPAVAGVLISQLGTGPVFLLNAASYLAVLLALSAMRVADLARSELVPRRRGQLREGLAYVRADPELLLPLVLVAVVGTFGLNFQVTMALIAKQTFERGAGAYGLLGTALAAGSLIGALLAASRSSRPRSRTLIGAALAFGVLEITVGLMPTYEAFLVMLIPTGIAILTFTTTANATVQLGARPDMRGRAMSLYVLVFLGGTPLGAPVIGWIASEFGPRWGLILGGVISIVAAAAVAGAMARVRGTLPLRGRQLSRTARQ
ncbi:MAG: MFS transporter [Actinomycetota bacterium]|nr:MFS transporter [Actinomycetota bacterium]